jgi:predicted RNA binding protein YcfA (HicA-like mRNA interferase family)
VVSVKKDLNLLIKLAEKQGWRVSRCGNSHIKMIPVDKTKQIVILPSSPSGADKQMLKWKRLLKGSGLKMEDK